MDGIRITEVPRGGSVFHFVASLLGKVCKQIKVVNEERWALQVVLCVFPFF